MNHERGWMVTAGTVSGYIIIAILCLGTIAAVYVHGLRWRYVTSLAIAVFVYGIVRELRRP
jgi:hypothetical protein